MNEEEDDVEHYIKNDVKPKHALIRLTGACFLVDLLS
jgi:hypothetical protein